MAMMVTPDRALTSDEIKTLEAMLARRITHEPMAYILGQQEFWSLSFAVGPGVLIPRPDTEALIELALGLKPDAQRVLDLGTGPGTVLCALLHEQPKAHGVGVDLSPVAVDYARKNVSALGLGDRALVLEGRWLDPVTGQFDLIVSNPPYIPAPDVADLMPDVRDHEPHLALVGGEGGLDVYHEFARTLHHALAPGGVVCLEIGAGQDADIKDIFQGAGWKFLRQHQDLAGHIRALAFSKI